jgi:ribosomal protein S18 acetylase RimI-like enzyme
VDTGVRTIRALIDHPLDNVVWTALTTSHASIAIGHGLARHYPRDITPFSAVAEPTERAYADLIKDLEPGLEVRLFRPSEEPAPTGWETLSIRSVIQMIAEEIGAEGAEAASVIKPLTTDDVPDILALTELTEPGPFGRRTLILGTYVGVRDPVKGTLLAMAGERFRVPGFVELSAVCVHPEARRRGLGQALTVDLMRRALQRGEVPFLHVFPDNPAVSLYARCGFRERTRLHVIWQRPRRIDD